MFENVHKASFEENREKYRNISKVSSPLHLLYETSVQQTFENVYRVTFDENENDSRKIGRNEDFSH